MQFHIVSKYSKDIQTIMLYCNNNATIKWTVYMSLLSLQDQYSYINNNTADAARVIVMERW